MTKTDPIADLLEDSRMKRKAALIARNEGDDELAYEELMQQAKAARDEAERRDPSHKSGAWGVE